MQKTVVIGFGNLLMGDDGVGPRVIEELATYDFPAWVELIDGGTASLDVLSGALAADRILIIDAMLAGGEPGDVYRLKPEDLNQPTPEAAAFSLHQFSLVQALQLLSEVGTLPSMVIYGIEPASLETPLELTPAVSAAALRVAELIYSEVHNPTDA